MNKHLHALAALAMSLALAACGGKAPEPAQAPGTTALAATTAAVESTPKSVAGKVDYVTISATGEGRTVPAAVNQAILLAVQQVNGQSVEAQSLQIEAGVKLAVDEQSVDIRSSAFADLIASRTRGRVSSFRILSQETDEKTGLHKIGIEAKIAKFTRPESANRLSVAVAEFRTGSGTYTIDKTNVASDEVARDIRRRVVNSLTESGRVSVLDREFEDETDAELQRIASGRVPQDDLARLGQQIATDFVLVGSIDRFAYTRHERALRTSDRTLVSLSGGAAVSIRLINVATGQIEQSETVVVDLPETEPTTLGTAVDVNGTVAALTDRLSGQASTRIIGHLFPGAVASATDSAPAKAAVAVVQAPKQSIEPVAGKPAETPSADKRDSDW